MTAPPAASLHLSPSQMERLSRVVGTERLWPGGERTLPYGRDESDLGEYPPSAVALAETTAEVSDLLRICSAERIPVTPSAARSGKSGGSLPVYGGLVLSLERMNRILEIRKEDLTGTVQPGVITGDYQRAVEALGLFYPPDPASLDLCTLGGNVAENAGGPRALKYGVTREYILGLEVVLPSGEVLRTGKHTIKGVAGFDLTALLVGSEGLLGIVTEITTKLIPLPRSVETALCMFASNQQACEAVSDALAAGLLPRALEFLDGATIEASAVAKAPFRFPEGCGAALLVEVDGTSAEACAQEIQRAGEICQRHGALEILVAQNPAQRRDLWDTRRRVSVNLKALHPKKLSEDIAVPRSRIPQMVAEVEAIGRRRGLFVACYGHAGDGNLHANVLFDREDQRPNVDAAVVEILEAAVRLDGTITGEHGVGLAKKEFLGLEQSPGLIALQKQLKAVFDPLGILNPGKMFPGA